MNYLPRIRPNPLHGRGPSGRPHPASLRNPRWGGGLYLVETRRVTDERNRGIGCRKQRRRTRHGAGGGVGGGALRCGTAYLDLFLIRTGCPCLLAVPHVSKQWTDKTRPHSSAINVQCTVKTANVRFEHL